MGDHLVEYRFACGRRASGGHLMGASKARWYGWVAVALTLAMVVAESAPLNMAPEEEATPPLAALRAKAKAFRESRTGRLRKMVADAEHEYGEVAEDTAAKKGKAASKKSPAASKKSPAASKKAPAAKKRKPIKKEKTPAAKKKASSKRSPPAGKKKKAASRRSSATKAPATKRPLAAKKQNALVETKADTKKPAAKANEADRKSAISTGKRILKRIQDQKKSIEAERRSTESSRAAKNAAEAAKKRAQAKAQARSKAKTTAKANAKAGAKGKKANISWEKKAEEQLATDMKEIAAPPETKKVVVKTQTPAAKVAPPGMTKKASAEKKKAPIKKQAPGAKKTPVAKKKAPVKKQTHAATKKAPVAKKKAPSKKKAPVVKKKAPVAKKKAPAATTKKVMAQTTLAKKAEKLAEEVTERTPVSVVQLPTPPVAPGLAHKEATILAQEKMAAMARQYDQQQMRAEQALLENNEMGEARDVRQENEAAVERAKARFMEDTAALNKVERVHTRSPSLLQRPQPLRDTQARPKHTITQLQKPSLSKHLQKKLANAAEQLAEKAVVGEDAKRAYQYE